MNLRRRSETWFELDGPGCIRHIWLALKHPRQSESANRNIIVRMYFDGATVPNVEAPVGDFFGVMHGVDTYPVGTPLLSVKGYSGCNGYFKMPFAKSARIEFETGAESDHVYLQVDWHRYLDQPLAEKRVVGQFEFRILLPCPVASDMLRVCLNAQARRSAPAT